MKKLKNPMFIYLYIMLAFMLLSSISAFFRPTAKAISVTEFETLFDDYAVSEMTIQPNGDVINVAGKYIDGDELTMFKVVLVNSEATANQLNELSARVDNTNVVEPNKGSLLTQLLISLLPMIVMLAIISFMMKRMHGSSGQGVMEFSKSQAKLQKDSAVRFSDVAGAEEEKEEMMELIQYLKDPQRFTKAGAHIPKGVLLVGPPGTGKTLLAKAVAGEANVPFYSISGSDFVEMFVGVGASRVRDMFKKASQSAPCILFIDEIDAVGRQRGAGLGGGNDEREQTLNQLLVEMDGIGANGGVVVIAATNRADVLDPALLRPGRFDRQITVGLPDLKGRTEILHVHARNKKIAESADLQAIARRTPGFSGADLANLLNEAAILTVRESKEHIQMEHLDEAIDRVMMGPAKKSRVYTPQEKRMVAFHEAGHTIVGLKLKSADTVQKVTIIPRGKAGGYNLMMPREENNYLHTKSNLLGKIAGLMGGRVSEELVFGEMSTGASDDIGKATALARDMVMVYGMSSLGPIQYEKGSGNVFLGRDFNTQQNYSSDTSIQIDKEVSRIIDEAYQSAKAIIEENIGLLEHIAEALIQYETLTQEDILMLEQNKPLNKAELPYAQNTEYPYSKPAPFEPPVNPTPAMLTN